MSPRDVATLRGPEAVVFDLLQRIVAIGRHRRAWDAATVARVCAAHLGAGINQRDAERRIQAERARADAAQAAVARLRERLAQHENPGQQWTPPGGRRNRVAYVSPLQAQVLTRACRGHTPDEIGAELGLSRRAVLMHLSRAADAMDADHPTHAVLLAARGVVEVRVRDRNPRGAAA